MLLLANGKVEKKIPKLTELKFKVTKSYQNGLFASPPPIIRENGV
jgi:hypothetical protein